MDDGAEGLTDRARLERLHDLLSEIKRRESWRFLSRLYPDEDVIEEGGGIASADAPDGTKVELWARHRYAKHLEFFRAGATYRERCAMCANRIGKTLGMGGYETTLHLTGLYPAWWEGRRFARPVKWWAAGKTNETTRDIVQTVLTGPVTGSGPTKRLSGIGLIPGNLLGWINWKRGVDDLVDTVKVRHVTGGWSTLGLKSYQQGRGAFEGTAQHGIWFDEEPPLDVYGEALIRTATTDGLVMTTFTPVEGVSETVQQFLPTEQPQEAA